MNRTVLTILLLAAAAFTGLLAYTLVGEGGSGSRGARSPSSEGEERVVRDAPAKPPEQIRATSTGRKTFRVSGRVASADGKPLSGALVRAAGQEGRTDEQGAYELSVPLPYFVFEAAATGYLPVADRYVGEGPGPFRLDARLEPAASLFGRLFGPDRMPVTDAQVYVISPDRALLEEVGLANVARSDAEGYFRFPGVPAGTYDLGVRARGLLPALVRDVVIPAAGQVERVVSLKAGRAIRVRVRNGTGETRVIAAASAIREKFPPPGGVPVLADALVGREYVDVPVVEGVRGKEGVYLLSGLDPGKADVFASDPRRITEPGLGSLQDTTAAELELVLVTATEIEIRVYDEITREELEPAIHRTSDGGSPIAVPYAGGAATVPADRRRHTLHFRLQGYEEAELELPPDPANWPESAFEVLMRPLAEGETGRFTVEFDRPFGQRVALVGRDADGRRVWTRHLEQPRPTERWVVDKVPFGEYRVSVLATGMIPVVLPRVVVAKNLNDHHRVTLSAGGGLEMKITDEKGELLEKVGILLKDADGNQIDVHVMMSLSDRRAFVSVNALPLAATARADSGLAPGAYTLTAYKGGYDPATEEFVIRATEVAQVTVALRRQ